MPDVNSRTERPRWWLGLRASTVFLLSGGLGILAYATLTHRPGGVPWGGLLFGALVCGALTAGFGPRPRR